MEAGKSAARDGDEQEREQVACEGRSRGGGREFSQSRHLHGRIGDENAKHEQHKRADLHQRGQVVTRGDEQPVRQRGGGEGVDHQCDNQFLGVQREHVGDCRNAGDPTASDDVDHEQHETEHRGFDNATMQETLEAAHDQGDRNGHTNREHGPRRGSHGLDGHERKECHGDGGHHDQEDRQDSAAELAHFVGCHLAEGTAATLGGDPQHEHILHGAGENHTENDPHHGRQITHLGSQNRTNKRARTGNAGEMLAEQHATVGTFEVGAVMHALGRRRVRIVGTHDLDLNIVRVETVSDRVGAQCHNHEPDGTDLLATGNRQNSPTNSAHNGDDGPQQGLRPRPHHLRLHTDREPLRIADDAFRFLRRVIILELQFAGRWNRGIGSACCTSHIVLSR